MSDLHPDRKLDRARDPDPDDAQSEMRCWTFMTSRQREMQSVVVEIMAELERSLTSKVYHTIVSQMIIIYSSREDQLTFGEAPLGTNCPRHNSLFPRRCKADPVIPACLRSTTTKKNLNKKYNPVLVASDGFSSPTFY